MLLTSSILQDLKKLNLLSYLKSFTALMYLIYDTETTGLPKNFSAPVSDSENWPRLVQVAWQLHNDMGELIEVKNFIVRPDGFTIPYNAEKIHGISTKTCYRN